MMKLQADNFDFYTFDVFDTLITRNTANPRGIFAIIQNVLNKDKKYESYPSVLKENFYNYRVEIEFFIRDNKRHSDINEIELDDIYNFLADNIPLSQQQKKDLCLLELKTEKSNLMPIEENINIIKYLISQKKKVALVSDTYLPNDWLKDVLISMDTIFENIPLYTSFEYKKTKSQGELFKVVKDKEGVDFSSWQHIGDNQKGDVDVPKKLGIHTIKYDYVKLTHYENEILRRYPENAYISLAVGCAKNTRLFNKSLDEKFELGVSMGGACLYPYIDWLVNQVKINKLTRLYFVMRDGEVLKELYDILAKKDCLASETKLIYGSREAWRSPSITKKNPDYGFMFASKREINTVRIIAARFHISVEKLINILPEKWKKYDKVFNDSEFNEIKDYLTKSNEFLELVETENTELRNMIKEYIKQEMNLSDDRFALVDLAASGRTQRCFINIINEIKDISIHTFYCQFNGLKINSEKMKMAAFFTTARVKSWIELFCRSECGYTKGYENINGKIVPVLDNVEGKALEKYEYSKIIEGEKKFCELFFDILKNNPFVSIDYKQFLFYLDYVANRPTLELANLVGDMPFSNYYGLKDYVYYCAPKITMKDLILGYDKTQIQLPKLSYIRSSKTVKKIMNFKNKHRSSLLKKIYIGALCLRQNGFNYTARLFFKKIINKFYEKK